MKTVWRILRIVLYTLLIVVAGAIGALVVLTKTERGRDNLAGIISRLASSDDRKITDRKSTRLNSSHLKLSRMPSSA